MKLGILIATMLLFVGCACEPLTTTTSTTTTTMPETLDVFTLGYQNELPVMSWQETRELAIDKFGSDNLWNCNEENMEFRGPPSDDYPFPENNGMYGYEVFNSDNELIRHHIGIECMQRLDATTSLQLLVFDFNPNDGKIQNLICDRTKFDNCPQDEEGKYIWIVYGRDMRK